MTTTPDARQLLYTPAEAAEALRISEAKLYQLIAFGEIDSLRIGRCRRIRLSALEDYLDGLSQPYRSKTETDCV